MPRTALLLFLFTYGTVTFAQKENPGSRSEHYQQFQTWKELTQQGGPAKSQEMRDFYNSLTNRALLETLLDISSFGDAGFTAHELSWLIRDRLDKKESLTGRKFRKSILDTLRYIRKVQNQDLKGFGLVALELTTKPLYSRIDFSGLNPKTPDQEHEINLHFEQLRNLAKDVQVDPDLRGRAIHYLGQDYSGENVIALNSFLSDQDPVLVKNTGRALRNYFAFISDREKDLFTEKLTGTLEKRKTTRTKKADHPGTTADDYTYELFEIRPVISALGMIKSPAAQQYLIRLNEETENTEVKNAIRQSLAYKATPGAMRYILSDFKKKTPQEATLLPALIEDNKDSFNLLRSDTARSSQIAWLYGLQVNRQTPSAPDLNWIKKQLNNPNRAIRREAVETLHLLLSYEEQVFIFRKHRKAERDPGILFLLTTYAGAE